MTRHLGFFLRPKYVFFLAVFKNDVYLWNICIVWRIIWSPSSYSITDKVHLSVCYAVFEILFFMITNFLTKDFYGVIPGFVCRALNPPPYFSLKTFRTSVFFVNLTIIIKDFLCYYLDFIFCCCKMMVLLLKPQPTYNNHLT